SEAIEEDSLQEAHSEGEELEATQEGRRSKGKELEAIQEGRRGKTLEAVQEAPPEGKELEATEEGPSAGNELELDLDLDESPHDLASDAAEAKEEHGDSEATESAPPKPEEVQGIRAPCPPGPTLSALALAFLMSELVSDSSKDLVHCASRYCAYLSA